MMQGRGYRIKLEDIGPGELECCGFCPEIRPEPGELFFGDLEYARMQHADHQLSPYRYGLPDEVPTSRHELLGGRA